MEAVAYIQDFSPPVCVDLNTTFLFPRTALPFAPFQLVPCVASSKDMIPICAVFIRSPNEY